jgi:hypothetical protein
VNVDRFHCCDISPVSPWRQPKNYFYQTRHPPPAPLSQERHHARNPCQLRAGHSLHGYPSRRRGTRFALEVLGTATKRSLNSFPSWMQQRQSPCRGRRAVQRSRRLAMASHAGVGAP